MALTLFLSSRLHASRFVRGYYTLTKNLVNRKSNIFEAQTLANFPRNGSSLARTLSGQNFSKYSVSSANYLLVPFPASSCIGSGVTQRLLYSSRRSYVQTTMAKVDIKDFTFPNDQPVVGLECSDAFQALSTQEKKYAHYLSQASWYGGLIVLIQTSPESPLIFNVLHQIHKHQSVDELKKVALDNGLSEEEFHAFLVYTSGFYTNMGNYKGFGDSKFVPNLPAEKLDILVKNTKAYSAEPSVAKAWESVQGPMYHLNPRRRQLGLGEKGISTYFSENCTLEDAEIVNRFMKSRNMEAYNNRVVKYEKDGAVHYEILMASSDSEDFSGITFDDVVFENCHFKVVRGDYAPLMRLVSEKLELAKEFASNEREVKMIEEYIKSFQTGSLDAHKDGSRQWIQNKGPIIETYIGFIETYRDPAGMRGEFEGFVAMVNKAMSAKFAELVDKAETLLPLLPWDRCLEKDTFLRPDFTSLDVLTFAGSGIPAGINIPNYDEIRQSEGFKNVSLGNVIPASYKDPVVPFISKEDQELLNKYRVPAFEVQVGLHELLGHGSGKLLRKSGDGAFNFNEEEIKKALSSDEKLTWYEEGETYDSKFTTMSSSYEECRAECVGLYLSLNRDVLKIFGFEGSEAEDVLYVNWLSLLWNGVSKALEMYQPETKAWLQAHSQARYVILRVLMEAGEGLVEVKQVKDEQGNDDLLLSLNRGKIQTVGTEALGKFLRKLQVYKSTGNVEAAREMYDRYSLVEETGPTPFASWRPIILAKKQPRKMFVQANTKVNGENVELKTYESSHAGLIDSWKDRFDHPDLYSILQELHDKDAKHFVNL